MLDTHGAFDHGVLCSGSRSASRLPVITTASSSSSSHTVSAARLMPEQRDHRMLVLMRKSRKRLLSARMAAWSSREGELDGRNGSGRFSVHYLFLYSWASSAALR